MAKSDQPIRKQVLIAGGGFSGVGIAIELLHNGLDDFVLLEKAGQLGGTWRENTYPGCACDVPSQYYSYSYAPNPDWSRLFAEQGEIQAYLLDVAERFGVMPYVRLNAALESAHWDDERKLWVVRSGETVYEADYLMACQGPLHEPRLPDVPGLDDFEGTVFHSAQWNHGHDLRGRRVAAVGTGSSAIQFVPKIQPRVEQLTVFQRTAPWVLPKPDVEVPAAVRAAFRHVPGFQKAFRESLYGVTELLQWAQRDPARMRPMEELGRWQLNRQVPDPELRKQLTPDFALGCKRLLMSNTWYPAIQADNAELVPHGMRELTPRGIVGADGIEREVDTVIFGTGFHVSDASVPRRVVGRTGRSLDETWAGTPRAYLGTTVPDFPNLFLLIGPNLGNGHGSAFVIIEAQARYIVDALKTARRKGIRSLEVRRGVERRWNAKVQEALAGTVWNDGGCNSWYIDGNGVNSSIYPWSTLDMRRRMRRFEPAAFTLTYEPRRAPYRPAPVALDGTVVAVTGGAHGIGLATARAFAAAGARVAIGDLDAAAARAAARELGDGVNAYPLDVADRASFAAFVEELEGDLGPVEVLVNNAGVMPTGDFLAEDDAVDGACMGINHRGASVGMKLVLPGMVARGRGHVVNVASLAGKFAVPYLSSYAASKHATVGLSASVRGELARTGVTVSTVMPAAVKTRLTGGIPLQGLFAQEPEDVAAAILESCRTRAAEIPVPKGLAALVGVYGMLPAAVKDRIPALLGADRLLRPEVREARAGYEGASVAGFGTMAGKAVRSA